VIHNPDGSTDTVTTTLNLDGSGTATDLNSSTNQTTSYTRTGWDASWVGPPADSGSGSDPSSGSDGASGSNHHY
jgi:hypothetical protein